MTIIPEIIEKHAEEAAFLWLLRDNAVHEKHSLLSDVTYLDDRPEAHIEKLRIAGESFAMITDVDLAYEDLEGEWPEGFEAGPTEDPEDEDVEMDPDEDLPWLDPELIHEWWSKNKNNFRNGTRYLCGKPISEQQCQHVLRYGYQRQRAAAAIELAMMNPEQPLFEVRAPGFRQQEFLSIK